ncbi:MAG: c-type cytochrome [Flavobacteriaceae bacterium]
MKNKIQLSIVLAGLMFLSCKEQTQNKTEYLAVNSISQLSEHPGKKLMETYCYVCHNPTASHDNRLAPPMIAIKKHYTNSDTTKEEFVNSIQAWIKNPNIEDAKMFGAVRRFGVMVKQPFPEDEIKLIAEYMFDNDIEQPEWFEQHEKEMKNKQ